MAATSHPVLGENPTLADIQAYVAQTNIFRGHHATTQAGLFLLCEEVGELAKAIRKSAAGIAMDTAKPSDARPDEEAADILWMLATICNSLNIDMEQALRAKEEKNKTRTWQ